MGQFKKLVSGPPPPPPWCDARILEITSREKHNPYSSPLTHYCFEGVKVHRVFCFGGKHTDNGKGARIVYVRIFTGKALIQKCLITFVWYCITFRILFWYLFIHRADARKQVQHTQKQSQRILLLPLYFIDLIWKLFNMYDLKT